jgi:hypothetical protein
MPGRTAVGHDEWGHDLGLVRHDGPGDASARRKIWVVHSLPFAGKQCSRGSEMKRQFSARENDQRTQIPEYPKLREQQFAIFASFFWLDGSLRVSQTPPLS